MEREAGGRSQPKPDLRVPLTGSPDDGTHHQNEAC